jgi:hypothetical protein
MTKIMLWALVCGLAAGALAADSTDTTVVLNERQKAAVNYEFCGVTLGITQRELCTLLPWVRRMSEKEILATGRSHNAQFGAERWQTTKGLKGASHAHFDFLDSTLYSMSWLHSGNRKAFDLARKDLEATFGHSDRQEGSTHTWVLKGVSRRIEIDFEPMVGVQMRVVDEMPEQALRQRREAGASE